MGRIIMIHFSVIKTPLLQITWDTRESKVIKELHGISLYHELQSSVVVAICGPCSIKESLFRNILFLRIISSSLSY